MTERLAYKVQIQKEPAVTK